MEATEYTFRIDIFTPDTLPMARLAEYMAALADLIGHKENTHFVRVAEGSACLVHKVEAQDVPKVDQRLGEIAQGGGPKEALKAFKVLDHLLADDNAVGELTKPAGAIVLPFPGRTRPKPLVFPAFKQQGTVEGQVVRIGGSDATAHVILQDGNVTFTGCSLSREMAQDLAKHLYGPKIRLIGSGRWKRHPEGVWELLNFQVDRFEVLDDTPLPDVLTELRRLTSLGDADQMYDALTNLRGEGELH